MSVGTEGQGVQERAGIEQIGQQLVVIEVDGEKHRVKSGAWVVKDLKAALRIDAALVLAEITRAGLKDLDDDARIKINGGEKFMTHSRSGGSS